MVFQSVTENDLRLQCIGKRRQVETERQICMLEDSGT